MSATVQLIMRFGKGIMNPSDADMRFALAEIYEENNPHCTEADYAEHPHAWVSYGFENGDKWTAYTVTVGRRGTVRIEKWDDQDDDEPVFEQVINAVMQDQALSMWRMLADGKIEELSRLKWRQQATR